MFVNSIGVAKSYRNRLKPFVFHGANLKIVKTWEGGSALLMLPAWAFQSG